MDFFIGTLMPFPYNFVPRGWMACNGQLLPIQQYSALFSLISTYYGGDGRQTFALPNMNTTDADNPILTVMGQGAGPGLTPRVMGEVTGDDAVTLDVTQMPAHGHSFLMPPAAGPTATSVPASGGVLIDQGLGTFVPPSQTPVTLNPLMIAPAGGSLPHENEQPWLSLYWCISYEGIYPQRP